MSHSKRAFVAGAAAALASLPILTAGRPARAAPVSSDKIGSLLSRLPGDIAFKIHAPPVDGKPDVLIAFNADKRLFVGSAIKTFVLCECLRQNDSTDVVAKITKKQLPLDAGVWSVDSVTLNPPHLTGLISERTALEAMIMHSDNTATDMALKLAGPKAVRAFIASAGLRNTQIPDSTRSFFGYLLGAKDYKTFTWKELQAAGNLPIVNSPLNTVSTLASSADDLVFYYERALQGTYFQHKETLGEFRRIQALGDAIFLLPLPLGVSGFVKGGSIDVPGFHCVCVPGGMFFSGRWVYFTFIINWYAKTETDPATVAAFVAAVRQALDLVFEALSA